MSTEKYLLLLLTLKIANTSEKIFIFSKPESNNLKVIHNTLLVVGDVNITMNGI